MGDSSIEWTDKTWNPVRGCTRVSEGCRHCYAERVAARFSGPGQPYEGLVTSKLKVISDDEQRIEARWTGDVRFIASALVEPLRWRKPQRVFVNSMSDLFHDGFSNEQIAAVFGVMAACPQHTFIVLTKRAGRMRAWFEWIASTPRLLCAAAAVIHIGRALEDGAAETWPLPNVILGVSVENQAAADERISDLLATPAAVRCISAEPLLGPLDLSAPCPPNARPFLRSPDRISWVIAGCESGAGARPCDIAWLRSLRDQCAAAAVPFFLKQARADELGYGGDEMLPITSGPGSKRKPGGIIGAPRLDDVQWLQFPEVRR